MNSRTRALGALLAVLALGTAACGDDQKTQAGISADAKPEASAAPEASATPEASVEPEASATPEASAEPASPAKAAFITAADELCAGVNDQSAMAIGALFLAGPPEPAVLQAALGKMLDLTDGQIADLRALTPPEGDEAEIAALWDEGAQMVGALRAKVATPEGAMEVVAGGRPSTALTVKMKAYGFADCTG